ncbi:hypothetical protein [Actinoplanes couchii]|uniref:Uncharacterized protein n=1 Tax=Actinoplanes couchii TaxID=403638 RepID=A0ABQ3WZE3_9ACTN|nr:hypothetical protein [Actinoplanes couchii]MDR6316033.1 hypothetical protein [Actinoplanes couchii]GID51646.1 hypothetical protein Aco03nite_000500 [Actinoplanes couchii]
MAEELTVALEALRADSDLWDGVSSTLGRAQFSVEGLTLTYSQLSWAGESSNLIDTYTRLQRHIADLLGQGSRNYLDLSVSLDKIALAYETNNEKAAKDFDDLWEPNE